MTTREECNVCGMPGIAGMSCSDPDCPGTVEDFGVVKATEEEPAENATYDKDLLESLENEKDAQVVSLESLKEEEETADESDYEDL